ncbi:MAG: hypothetical protein ACR2QQ_10720 [Gammaproteobacteria bacterium]
MTPYELADLTITLGNRIDFHWGLFITVHLALLGAIIYIDRPLRRLEKVGTLLLYLGFAAINYQQMAAQIETLDSVYQDVVQIAATPDYADSVVIQRMATEANLGRIAWAQNLLVVSHLFMFFVVTLSIVFDRKVIQRD